MDLRSVGSLHVFNGFPTESRVTAESIPVQPTQQARAGHDLFQFRQRNLEETMLKLRAVQIESNSITCGRVEFPIPDTQSYIASGLTARSEFALRHPNSVAAINLMTLVGSLPALVSGVILGVFSVIAAKLTSKSRKTI